MNTNPSFPPWLRLSAKDNVAVAILPLAAGTTITLDDLTITVAQPVPPRHKIALTTIPAGAKVLKYGLPIGSATVDIQPGTHVHTHNLQSDYLSE